MAVIDPLVYEARVRRGARFMDERHPGWHTKINLDELIMSDGTCCIIGQTYGFYGNAVLKLRDADFHSRAVIAWETKHGFNLPQGLRFKGHRKVEENWDLLRKLWEVQIQERLIMDMV